MEILGGPSFTVAGAGESHGPAVTTIVGGVPPGHRIERGLIQSDLDRRRPGGNKHGTPRNEKDQVAVLAGLYQSDHHELLGGGVIEFQSPSGSFQTEAYDVGYTTGEPIAAVVLSTSKKSKDYGQLGGGEGAVRPGHTDLVKHHQSRGYVDVRGGGRSSYRSTISDVIGGSIAKQILREVYGTEILSSIWRVGPDVADARFADTVMRHWASRPDHRIASETVEDWRRLLDGHVIASHDAAFAQRAAKRIMKTRRDGDSLGAAVEVIAVNVPPLLGQPLYQGLKGRLMATLGGLNAVQACEIGDGAAVAERVGSENNDAIRRDGYQTNSHGGLIGGITTGSPLVASVAFKPTSTIHTSQKSVRKDLTEIDFELESGRHDPCVGVRAGVTLEARMAIELLNAALEWCGKDLRSNIPKLFDP